MATQWFYQNGSEEIGPISPDAIRSLAKSATILPDTLIRKSDSSDWIKASRVKGLFGATEGAAAPAGEFQQPSKESGQDPLVALTSQAATSLVSGARSAASAIGGAISGAMAPRKEKPPAADQPVSPQTASKAGPSWLDAFTRDDQSPEVVAHVAEMVQGILMAGEQLLYVAVQNKPLVNWKPDCIALTNKRFIFYRPKLLGRVDFQDYVWRDLHDARLSENIIGSTFSIQTAEGAQLSLDYLPKAQARAIYRIAQEMEEQSLEQRRQRNMEEMRAGAGGVVLQADVGVPPPRVAPAGSEANDPMQKLQQLKSMLDAGLLTAAEYEAKKAEILSRF